MSSARYSRISKCIANRELQGSIALSISHTGRPLKSAEVSCQITPGAIISVLYLQSFGTMAPVLHWQNGRKY